MADPLDYSEQVREALARLKERQPHWQATVYIHEPDQIEYPPLNYSAELKQVFDDGLSVEIEHSRKEGGGWWARIAIEQRREKYASIDAYKTDVVFEGLYGSDHTDGLLAYKVLSDFIHQATEALAQTRADSIRESRVAFFGQNRYDPAATPPQAPAQRGGCFVATAAYGSHDRSVVVLQAYRDRVLTRTPAGKNIVRLYYLVSPLLARFIQASAYRRSITRVFLRPVVVMAERRIKRAS